MPWMENPMASWKARRRAEWACWGLRTDYEHCRRVLQTSSPHSPPSKRSFCILSTIGKSAAAGHKNGYRSGRGENLPQQALFAVTCPEGHVIRLAKPASATWAVAKASAMIAKRRANAIGTSFRGWTRVGSTILQGFIRFGWQKQILRLSGDCHPEIMISKWSSVIRESWTQHSYKFHTPKQRCAVHEMVWKQMGTIIDQSLSGNLVAGSMTRRVAWVAAVCGLKVKEVSPWHKPYGRVSASMIITQATLELQWMLVEGKDKGDKLW